MGRLGRLHLGTRAVWRRVRAGFAALAVAAGRVAAEIRYRQAELVVIGLLAGSLLAGFAVEVWRQRDPTGLERLETEPLRRGATLRPPAPHRSALRPAARSPGSGAHAPTEAPRGRRGEAPPTAEGALDLNRATADDLVRLPGIGPSLAARILTRRAALGGRFLSADELATVPGIGRHKATLLRPLVAVPTPTVPLLDMRDPLEPWEPP